MSPPNRWSALRSFLGPLLPAVALAVALLALLTLARAGLTALNAGRATAVEGWPWLFLVGLRMDLVLVCMVASLPVLALAAPMAWWPRLRRPYQALVTGAVVLIAFFEIATVRFLAEYDRRPDRLFWEYLDRPREVVPTVLAEGWPWLLAAVVVLPLAAWGVWRLAGRVVDGVRPWPVAVRLALLPVLAGLLFLGIRGVSHRAINVSTAAFSDENLLNQLALNSTYSAAYALYALRHEGDPSRRYGRMDRAAIIAEARRASLQPAAAFASDELPTLHRRAPAVPARQRPPNIVIVLEESLGAQFTGCLGGTALTPNLDALAKEGLLLTRLFATGTRTVRGIEATVCGFPPTPGTSVVKLGLSQSGFFSAADLLRRHGYRTLFFYGGESHFDNMRSFFQGNGFQTIVDEPLFTAPLFRGTWGVSDEDLVRRAVTDLAALGDQPFFALLLSTSHHAPFEFPDGIELAEQPKQTQRNAIKYADHAIGEFVRLGKQQAFWRDTIVMVVADHDVRTTGDSLVPVKGFHIPGVIVGPGFAPGTHDRPSSQLDLLTTILARTGIAFEHPLIGHDLLALPADHPGRAIMQFGDNHGYLVGDRLVVHVPQSPARRFRMDGWKAVPAEEAWPELEREALAHALLPGLLYRERRYRLP